VEARLLRPVGAEDLPLFGDVYAGLVGGGPAAAEPA
jgi:hypothetical protein